MYEKNIEKRLWRQLVKLIKISMPNLQAFSVHENLFDILRLHVDVLNFLGNNVFALTQFENVFFSVDNF